MVLYDNGNDNGDLDVHSYCKNVIVFHFLTTSCVAKDVTRISEALKSTIISPLNGNWQAPLTHKSLHINLIHIGTDKSYPGVV